MSRSRVQEVPPSKMRGIILSQIRRWSRGGGDVVVLIAAVRAGLPMAELVDLRDALDLPMERVAAKIGMSRATFHRRQKTGVLSSDESDKALRLARILGHAISIFENEEMARQWLNSPQPALGGEVPLDFAETEIGAREVEHLLGRIDYGVYT